MKPFSMAVRVGLSAGILAGSAGALQANPFPPMVWQCMRNEYVTVLAHDKAPEVGTKFLIRQTTGDMKADCTFEERPGDGVIGNEADSAFYYIALANRFLILDDGTGPDRELRIYNLPATSPVFRGDYSVQGTCNPTTGCESEEFNIDANGITFWLTGQEKATARNCRDYAKFMKVGTDPEIEQKSFFRFSSQKVEPLKEKRCVPAQ